MIYLHFLAAILATWRMTDLMTQDRIMQPLRTKLNTYLWSCPRCMSVWCGALCALMFWLGPITHDASRWALWPFALAWLYIWRMENVYARRIVNEGRQLVVKAQGAGVNVARNDFSPQETQQILSQMLTELVRLSQPPMPTVPPVPPPAPARANGGAK